MFSPQTFIKYVSLALLALSLQCKRHIYFTLVHNCNTELRLYPNTAYAHVMPMHMKCSHEQCVTKMYFYTVFWALSDEQLFHINPCVIKRVNIWYIHTHLSVHNLETTCLISTKHFESNSPSPSFPVSGLLRHVKHIKKNPSTVSQTSFSFWLTF